MIDSSQINGSSIRLFWSITKSMQLDFSGNWIWQKITSRYTELTEGSSFRHKTIPLFQSSPWRGSSHFTDSSHRLWNNIFTLIMNGLIRPRGSNILAVTFKSGHLVTGSPCAYSINSEKQNRNSLVGLLHVMPSSFDTSDSRSVQDFPRSINELLSGASDGDSLIPGDKHWFKPCSSASFICSSN